MVLSQARTQQNSVQSGVTKAKSHRLNTEAARQTSSAEAAVSATREHAPELRPRPPPSSSLTIAATTPRPPTPARDTTVSQQSPSTGPPESDRGDHRPTPPRETSQQSLLDPLTVQHEAGSQSVAASPVSSQGNGEEKPQPSPKASTSLKVLSHKDKLGIWSIIVFSASPVLILASVGILSFLWFGTARNSLWKAVMQRNWLTKAVAICAEVLKQAISFQLALIVGMLASLALERFDPLLQQIASFTMMRATSGSGTVLVMFWHYVVSFWHARWKWSTIFGLTVVASLVYGLTQIVSILLLSDIDLRTIPGTAKDVNTSFAFAYHYANNCIGDCTPSISVTERGGTWFRKAPDYPVFAEYSEPAYQAQGVSDTGLTLRALLPFQAAQDRESLMAYSGRTTVLDTRVTCQIPDLINERVQLTRGMEGVLLVEGGVRASRSTPRLGNATLSYHTNSADFYVFNSSALFSCLAPLSDTEQGNPSEWRISICQLGEGDGGDEGSYAGGLISEFKNLSTWWGETTNRSTMQDWDLYGTAYLVFNVTTGDQQAWQAIVEDGSDDAPGSGYAPPAYSERNEWLDLVFNNGKMVLSSTLCYSAFDSANLPVSISSVTNRTEPSPTFNFQTNQFEFPQVRQLLFQPSSGSAVKERGVLQLRNQSWTANATEAASDVEPFVRAFADLAWGSGRTQFGQGMYGNSSGLLHSAAACPSQYTNTTLQGLNDVCVVPEQMHIWLFQEILQTGGSVASALQAMLTLLSTMAYYDQLGQFDDFTGARQTFYMTANVPVNTRGFIVVVVTMALHLALSGAVLALFLEGTRFSRIGATWSALAQGTRGAGRAYAERAGMCGDGDVEDMMNKDGGVGRVRAGLGVADVDVDVVVVETKATGRQTQESAGMEEGIGRRKVKVKERVALVSDGGDRREEHLRSMTV